MPVIEMRMRRPTFESVSKDRWDELGYQLRLALAATVKVDVNKTGVNIEPWAWANGMEAIEVTIHLGSHIKKPEKVFKLLRKRFKAVFEVHQEVFKPNSVIGVWPQMVAKSKYSSFELNPV